MSVFSYIRGIYALDTIDTRFTNSSANAYQTVIDGRAQSAEVAAKRDDSIPGPGVRTDHSGRPIAQPSKWKTPEFYFYYFIFIITVPYMFWIAYDVSRRGYTVSIVGSKAYFEQLPTKITTNTNTYFHQDGYLDARL